MESVDNKSSELNSNKILNNPKRKRGRPRKIVINPLVADNNNPTTVPEEIILILPITVKEINEKFNLNLTAHNQNSNSLTNGFIINEFVSQIEKNEVGSHKYNKLSYEIQNKENEITNLHERMKPYEQMSKILSDLSNGVKLTKLNVDFIDANNNFVNVKSSLSCWWCTESFDTIPCVLPEKYYANVYYVFGCFCSFNCVSAYNINLKDYKVSNRYSLIKKLCHYLYGDFDNYESIILAPPKEVLKKYGGKYTIDEYRKDSLVLKPDYTLIFP